MSENVMKNNDVTILVNSCDFYEDAWYPFFKLLEIHWKDCPYSIVLNTENKEYNCDFMSVRTIKTGNDISWTARLRKALNSIDSEFVLFFLEDFFLTDDVNVLAFNKALEIIKNDKNVGMVHFTPCERDMPVPQNDIENCFYELPVRKRTLRTRVAVTLFRKEYFLRLLFEDENPWQYERESHYRSMFAGYKIIRQDYKMYPPTFSYYLDHNCGIGITQRKWLPKNKALFESVGIYNINYDNLGILTNEEREKQKKKSLKDIGFREWFYQNFSQKIKRKIRHVWFLQDIISLKKYIKYWLYYRKQG